MAYFTSFPEIQYDIKKDTNLTQIDDLFVRYRIREQIKTKTLCIITMTSKIGILLNF